MGAHHGDEVLATIAVVEEAALLEKRRAVTGIVRASTEVHERDVVINEPLITEEVTIERLRVDRWIDTPVPVRQEGDTTIIPVVEEVVVVEKRLKLIEEVRITKHRSVKHDSQSITLRRNEVVIDRLPTTNGATD